MVYTPSDSLSGEIYRMSLYHQIAVAILTTMAFSPDILAPSHEPNTSLKR